jgi:hypothetical protein
VECLSVGTGNHGYAFAQAAKQALFALENAVWAKNGSSLRKAAGIVRAWGTASFSPSNQKFESKVS